MIKDDIQLTRLEVLLHAKKINYNKLNNLLFPQITNKSINEVNVFIDLYDVFKPLYNPNVIEEFTSLSSKEKYMVTSEVINIAAHYRHYICSRLQRYCNVYYFYSDSRSRYHTDLYADYRKDFYEKRLTNNIPQLSILNNKLKENIKLIKIFLEYVPHTYLVNTGEIEYTMFPYLNIEENKYNIIISNDSSYLQDISLKENTILLQDNKGNPKLINKLNLNEEILSKCKSKNKINIDFIYELYPLLFTLVGDNKHLNLNSYRNMGYYKAIKYINNLLEESKLSNTKYTLASIVDVINNEKFLLNYKLIDKDTIMNDINQQQYLFMDEQIKDKIDIKSIKYVCEKYFERHPILLNYLFDGETYE